MSDLGALLRKAREQRGYSLDDIQEFTKIRKRYLEAIETGDYKVLPGSFYVRAFVKTYAETVGLDAEEVLRLYQKELPKSASSEIGHVEVRNIQPKRRSVQHNDRWGKVAVSLLMWAFPILIAAVIYIYYSNTKDSNPDELGTPPPITSETGTPTPSVSLTPTPTPSPTPTPTPSPTVTMELTETKQGKQYYSITSGTGHKLQIDISGYVWVGVYPGTVAKGKGLLNKTVTDKEVPATFSYPLDQQLFVNIGRADRAVISIDGVTVDDGDKPGPVRIVFTPTTGESNAQ
ncbi:helix-turn-helix domain-containing protein [Cohnella yongneupensis]|uniref:Helix-turn-helix domain-containing protein n=1 Tax=Cohnella yongneupensis TaxID=425006 RepID=A0ABW0RAW1_9BACL